IVHDALVVAGRTGHLAAEVRPRRLRLMHGWQADDEGRSFAGHAARLQRPAHQLGQALADHEPDAGALLLRALAPEPVERLEQLAHLLGRHADAGVGDGDLDHFAEAATGDVDTPAVDVVL